MKWFEQLFGQSESDQQSYEREKMIAVSGSVRERMGLAKSARTHPEILFYLAQKDPEASIRRMVARNRATPLHASTSIAVDKDMDVRQELAKRLVKILPDLSVDTQSQVYAYAVQALGTLALDEVLKIRKALASTLKDHAYAPPSVAAQLAKDIEREVSEPILRFCVALRDEDLIEILATHPATWAAEAVASRPAISAPVSKAVIKTGNSKAGTILLKNKGADINEDVLLEIIERAKEFPEWHEPLATNHTLPPEMAKTLARYVDGRVRKLLIDRGEYDIQTTEVVADATRRRIDLAGELGGPDTSIEGAVQRVNKLLTQGRLNEEIIGDALALQDRAFIVAALACLTGISREDVHRALSIKKPKLVCSLCWKAKLSMRFALQVQQMIAHIPPRELIYPRGGTDYPLEPKDMQWQLDFLEGKDGIGLEGQEGKK